MTVDSARHNCFTEASNCMRPKFPNHKRVLPEKLAKLFLPLSIYIPFTIGLIS